MTIPLLRDVSLNSSGIVCELSGIAEQARTPSQIRRPITSVSLSGVKTLPAENLVVSQFEIHSPCAGPEPGRILGSWQSAHAI
jgi:hypothetical protein